MNKMQSPERSVRARTWLMTALLAATAAVYCLYGFLPLERSITALRAELDQRREYIEQAQAQSRGVVLARQLLVETREVSRQWRATAPRQSELITHLANLTHQAQAAGVAIERLDPLPAVELRLVAQQHVTIQFHSVFAEVFELLRRLEALPGTIWIRSVRMEALTPADNKLRGELTLTIFVDRGEYAD